MLYVTDNVLILYSMQFTAFVVYGHAHLLYILSTFYVISPHN